MTSKPTPKNRLKLLSDAIDIHNLSSFDLSKVECGSLTLGCILSRLKTKYDVDIYIGVHEDSVSLSAKYLSKSKPPDEIYIVDESNNLNDLVVCAAILLEENRLKIESGIYKKPDQKDYNFITTDENGEMWDINLTVLEEYVEDRIKYFVKYEQVEWPPEEGSLYFWDRGSDYMEVEWRKNEDTGDSRFSKGMWIDNSGAVDLTNDIGAQCHLSYLFSVGRLTLIASHNENEGDF